MSKFGNRLSNLRRASDLTQDQVAKAIGLSRNAVSMYERGEREPDFDTLEIIADFFNVDIDYLTGRSDKTTLIPQSGNYRNPGTPPYYFDEDARDLAQFAFENPEYKVLFDASRKVKKEDIEFIRNMIERAAR